MARCYWTPHVSPLWQPFVIVSMGICLHVLVGQRSAEKAAIVSLKLDSVECKLRKNTYNVPLHKKQTSINKWWIKINDTWLDIEFPRGFDELDCTLFWNCPNLWSNGFLAITIFIWSPEDPRIPGMQRVQTNTTPNTEKFKLKKGI